MSIAGDNYRHGLRRLTAREIFEQDRAASPLELLYDLTFVAAFGVAGAELSHAIATGHAVDGVAGFLVSMITVVWAWINFTWFASAFDNDDWLFRVLTIVQMAGVVVVAIGLPSLFASIVNGGNLDNGVMVGGYIVMRVAVVLQWLRVAHDEREYRKPAITYAVFVGAAQVGWLLLAISQIEIVIALGVVAVLFAVESLAPVIAGVNGALRHGRGTPWHPQHIAERHILLTIIALGETVFGTLGSASTITSAEGWHLDAVVVIAAGIVMSFALWWLYLLVPHAQILQLRRDRALPWGYGHIVLYLAVAAIGAGMHVVGYRYVPEHPASVHTVVLAVAIPVIVFVGALSVLNAWLLPAPNVGLWFQVAVLAPPAGAILLSYTGGSLWVCILLVLASPIAIIVGYELGGWRLLSDRLASARRGTSEELPGGH